MGEATPVDDDAKRKVAATPTPPYDAAPVGTAGLSAIDCTPVSMLRSFRTAARSWLAKLLFALLILSFAAWGIEDMVRRAGPSDDPATVGDVAITRAEVDVEFRRMVDRLRPMLGGDFTNEQAVKLGFVDQAAQTVAQRALLRLAAENAGLAVSVEMVRNQIAGDKGFQNSAGQFDAGIFMETLRRNNLSEQAYIALLREDMARELLTSPIVSGAYAPKTLVQALFAHRGERRVAETITLPHRAITDVPAADDATLTTYHAENPIAFTAPEYRKLTVVQLLLDDLAKEVKVADADVAQAYEERRGEFETPERRKLRMAVLGDETKAMALMTAAATQGFDAAAKAAGVDVVDLGEATKDDLPGLGEALFKPIEGGPIEGGGATIKLQVAQSPLGWHVVETLGVTPGSARPLAEVRDRLAKDVARERAADSVFQISNQLDDKLAGGAPLEEVARDLGLRLTAAAAVDATGKSPDDSDALAGSPDAAQIIAAAFGLAPGGVSSLAETRGGDFFVVRVDSIIPPALRPFAEVREKVAAAWKAERQAAKAKEKAAELADKLKTAAPDAGPALAAAAGAQHAATPPFVRDQAPGLPPDLVAKLFTLNPGDVAQGETGDAQVITRLKEIIPADPAAQADTLAALETTAAQGLERDLLAQLIGALQQQWPIVLHQDRINRLYSQN